MILVRRAWRDRRRSLLWWSLGIFVLLVFVIPLYPSIEGSTAYDDLGEQFPEAVQSLFGLDGAVSLTSPAGYLWSQGFSILPVVFIIFAIAFGARAVAGDEADGTLELLLANPLTRSRLVLERALTMVLLVAVLVVVSAVLTLGGSAPVGLLDGISITSVIGATVAAGLLGLLHGAIAFTAGAAGGTRAFAIGLASAVAVAGYLLQALQAMSDVLEPLRFITPWYWFLSRNMLAQGVPAEAIVAPAVVSVVLFAVAVPTFKRRDLR